MERRAKALQYSILPVNLLKNNKNPRHYLYLDGVGVILCCFFGCYLFFSESDDTDYRGDYRDALVGHSSDREYYRIVDEDQAGRTDHALSEELRISGCHKECVSREHYHSERERNRRHGMYRRFILLEVEGYISHNADDIERKACARTEKEEA